MVEFVTTLFSPAGFAPRFPGFSPQAGLLWLPELSDLCVALVNCAMFLTVLCVLCKRQQCLGKRVFIISGALMFFYGMTHLSNILTMWHGAYHFAGLVTFAPAASVAATAALLCCVMPAALTLPAPEQPAPANQTETAFQLSQEMFTQLFEYAPDALVLANAAGEIIAVNSQTERLFGYARQELWGQPVELLLPERFHQRHRQHREQYIAAPRVRAMGEGLALSGRRKGGQEFLVEISLSPLHLAERLFVVSAIRDLTERQRTAEALRQAEHLARLGRLAAGVSHDLRNPLASVALHVEVIEETLLAPTPENLAEVSASLATIKTEIARIHDLVQDYLTLATPTTLQRQTLDFWTFVHDFVGEVQPRVRQHGVTLHWQRPTIVAPVALHLNAFRRVLFNLVQNALDAMPQGGSLVLHARQTAAQIQLDMCDTGAGIQGDHLRRIFEPLYTTKPTGTGLGLYLVQEIVAAHGGLVAVQSEVGHGATVTITLPLMTTPAPLAG
jgi:protein-histidine pros-kinase